ncbi:MAG: hypothetical protein JWN54_1996, partial [Mycobacterium sp.]|nr:hypothetical protein [Mycobacterium sp.]
MWHKGIRAVDNEVGAVEPAGVRDGEADADGAASAVRTARCGGWGRHDGTTV